MASTNFTPSDEFLMGRWSDATELIRQADELRSKLAEFYSEVARAFLVEDPRFDLSRHMQAGNGSLGVGRRDWPATSNTNFVGLWLERIDLDSLVSDEALAPFAGIWLKPAAPSPAALEQAIARVQAAATSALNASERLEMITEFPRAYRGYALGFEFLSKREVLRLLSTGQTPVLREHILNAFRRLSKFTDVLNETLSVKLA